MLDELFKKKSSVPYSSLYISSSTVNTTPFLGTIEADTAGRYGRWDVERFRAEKLANITLASAMFDSVLDIGAGSMLASAFFASHGKVVDVCDYPSSPYFPEKDKIFESHVRNFIEGDFNEAYYREKI